MTNNAGIYIWTSPSGKSYVGQAIDLAERKRTFLSDPKTNHYSSGKGVAAIDRARKKYSDFSLWKYEVLASLQGDDVNAISQKLNELEIYFIALYDTYNKGYNSTKGGGGITGYRFTDEQRKKLSEAHKRENRTEESLRKLSERFSGSGNPMYGVHLTGANNKKSKPVIQMDMEGNFIARYANAIEAAKAVNGNNSEIGKACKGKIKSTKGYKWKYETKQTT